MSVPAGVEHWRPLAEKYAIQSFPIVANEILAIIWNESHGNPAAKNPNDPSWGLMQLTIPIARAYGKFQSGMSDIQIADAIMDPETNIRIGSSFLGYLKRVYSVKYPNGAWVAAYNEGEGNLLKGLPDLPYVTAWLGHLAELNGEQM